jgi:hypothetical protein
VQTAGYSALEALIVISCAAADAGEAVVPEWPPGEATPEWAETEFP